MNKSDIRDGVREIVATVLSLPEEQVSPDADFYGVLGGDSLQKLEVVAFVEARFHCRLTHEQAATSETVEALTDQVATHVL